MSESERLLDALMQCNAELDDWIGESEDNAMLFLADPIAALQAAAADSEPDVAEMIALEAVLSGLARKLDLPLTTHVDAALEKAS